MLISTSRYYHTLYLLCDIIFNKFTTFNLFTSDAKLICYSIDIEAYYYNSILMMVFIVYLPLLL